MTIAERGLGIIMDDKDILSSQENTMQPEKLSQKTHSYLTSLYGKLSGWEMRHAETEQFVEHASAKIMSIININNTVARYYRSSEYLPT